MICVKNKFTAEYIGRMALIIVSIICSFITVFYALNVRDTFFHACNFLFSNQISTFLPLTQGLYILIVRLFGDSVIAIRIFDWLIYFISYILVCKIIDLKYSQKNILYIALSTSILLIPIITTNVYNGNSLTVLFIMLSFVSIYKIDCGIQWTFMLGLSVGCAILSRFPNIVLLPFIMIGSLFLGKKSYLRIFMALIISIIIYLGLIRILYGGLSEYKLALMHMFTNVTSDTEGANHSISYLFSEYLHTLKDIISNVKYLSIIAIIPFISFFLKKMKYVIPLIFIVAQISFVYFRIEIVEDIVNYFLMVYLYSNVCIVIFILAVLGLFRHDFKLLSYSLLILLLSLSAAAGSDTGLCLIGGPLFAFIPWLMITLSRVLKPITKEEIFTIIWSLGGLSVCAALYVRNGMMIFGIIIFFILLLLVCFYHKLPINTVNINALKFIPNHRMVFICIGCFAILSLGINTYAYLRRSYFDAPFLLLNTQHSIPSLKMICTNSKTKAWVDSVVTAYQSIEKNKLVYFFGSDSAIFSYLTKTRLIPGVDFTQRDTMRNREAINMVLKHEPIIILPVANPITHHYTFEDYRIFDQLMMDNGYNVQNHKLCRIYRKSYDKDSIR